MAQIRVTKIFSFEMAHALYNHDGACKNIHGHSYKLMVTIKGSPCNNPNSPKDGMVIDFSELKNIVKKNIIDIFDHSFVLNQKVEPQNYCPQMNGNTIFLPYQPTCENLIIDFAGRLKALLPSNLELYSLKLYETATSFAEWFAADN